MEASTDRNQGPKGGKRFYNHASERLRILGEIPVRKFTHGNEPLDPDGNPDTSFLAKIPADVGFTFQTIDRHGMVLNAAQTWHQLRPGEARTNCGGCHAHSQQPTQFEKTAAARPDYPVWDLSASTPLVTARGDAPAVRHVPAPLTVEYWRDIRPILDRSCVSCHTTKDGKQPAGKLDLDADGEKVQAEHHGTFPGTYYRLAMDERGKFGHRPPGWDSWGYPNASRYVRKFQSRRSLLVWNVHGRRLDGFVNDDHPSETKPGSGVLAHRGQVVDLNKHKARYDIDYAGTPMPPPDSGATLTDEDRRTIARWIDLGCPIDLDYDPAHPERRGFGYMLDDQRPTVAVSLPAPGANAELSRVRVGLYDLGTGLNPAVFRVTADVPLAGAAAGEDLAGKFRQVAPGVWELPLAEPVRRLPTATLTVSVADKQGNVTRVERRFRVGP
jgi:mono/diheme cytochrome c family protein